MVGTLEYVNIYILALKLRIDGSHELVVTGGGFYS